jgi:GWxTD domain-containing protein
VHYIGFELTSRDIDLRLPQDLVHDFALKQIALQGERIEVTAERAQNWDAQLQRFQEWLIGKSKNAKKCRLLNPEILRFSESPDSFIATADSMLFFENLALGYTIRALLQTFHLDKKTDNLKYRLFPVFSELHPQNEKQRKQWAKARRSAYEGSFRHFVASLAYGTVLEEKFQLYFISEWDRDDKTWGRGRSLEMHELDMVVELDPTGRPNLNFNGVLHVFHGGSRSIVTLNARPVLIDTLGNCYDEKWAIDKYGDWTEARLADTLPTDFHPWFMQRISERTVDLFEQQAEIMAERGDINRAKTWRTKAIGLHGQMAMNYIERNEYDKAQGHLERALKMDPDLGRVYYGFARLNAARQGVQHETRKWLRSALDKDPGLIAGWLMLSDLELSAGQHGAAARACADGLHYSPNSQELLDQLLAMAHWHDKHSDAISALERYVEQNNTHSGHLIALAELNFAAALYDSALVVLDKLKHLFPTELVCRRHLLRAKIYFETGNYDEGQTYLQSAMASAADTVDADMFFRDLRYIMNDSEYDIFQRIRHAEPWHFFSSFWRSRDPNLATPNNEFIPEFYRRLSYARKHFRRYAKDIKTYEGHYRTAEAIDDAFVKRGVAEDYEPNLENVPSDPGAEVWQDHDPEISLAATVARSGAYALGEQVLMNAHYPQALLGTREIDDRGLIYVRHGEPDRVVHSGQQMSMSCQYNSQYGNPSFTFHFTKFGNETGWMFESVPSDLHDREMLDAYYWSVNPDNPAFANAPMQASIMDEFAARIRDETKTALEAAMRSITPSYRYDGEPFEFPYQMFSFKGPEQNSIIIDFLYHLDGRRIDREETGEAYKLWMSKLIGFYDDSWQERVRLSKNDTLLSQLSQNDWRQYGLTDWETFTTMPGFYNYEIQLHEGSSDKISVYRGTYNVPEYHSDVLMLSDILISAAIEPVTSSSAYQKGDLAISPHMFDSFTSGEQVGLYFEVYNLTYNVQGRTNFRVECTMSSDKTVDSASSRRISGFFQSLFGSRAEAVGTSYDYVGNARDESLYMNFDLGDETSGDFHLSIDVTDLNSGMSTAKSVTIVIE